MSSKLQIELGGNRNPLKLRDPAHSQVLNIDALQLPEVDIVCDVTKGLPFDDGSVEYIYSCHFMEHISYEAAVNVVLPECYRVLGDGGRMVTQMPDLDRMVALWHRRCDCVDYHTWRPQPDCPRCAGQGVASRRRFREYLLGGQQHEYDYHRCVWGGNDFCDALRDIGFADITQKDFPFPLDCLIESVKRE